MYIKCLWGGLQQSNDMGCLWPLFFGRATREHSSTKQKEKNWRNKANIKKRTLCHKVFEGEKRKEEGKYGGKIFYSELEKGVEDIYEICDLCSLHHFIDEWHLAPQGSHAHGDAVSPPSIISGSNARRLHPSVSLPIRAKSQPFIDCGKGEDRGVQLIFFFLCSYYLLEIFFFFCICISLANILSQSNIFNFFILIIK